MTQARDEIGDWYRTGLIVEELGDQLPPTFPALACWTWLPGLAERRAGSLVSVPTSAAASIPQRSSSRPMLRRHGRPEAGQ